MPATEDAILTATRELLSESGFAQLSIEAVAARAGVSRPTIYRRWPSKLELVVDAVLRAAPPLTPTPTGDPLINLTRLISRLVTDMTNSPIGRLIITLTSDAATPPELRTRLTDDYLEPRRAVLRAILTQAITDGQLAAHTDPDLTLDLMLGAPTYQWITTGRPVERHTTTAIVRAVWNAHQPH